MPFENSWVPDCQTYITHKQTVGDISLTSPFFELMTTEPALPFDDGSPADRYLSEMISCATSSPHMPYTVPAVHAPTE